MLRADLLTYQWPEETEFCYSLEVAPGEIVALTGPSGGGKSTLLDLIAGFIPPVSGSLSWEGRSLLGLRPDRRPVSMLFQMGNLFDHLTCLQNIALGLSTRAKLDADQSRLVLGIIREMGLEGLERRCPPEMSGGQQQRVALARALVREKPLLLLDEPFNALDPDTRQDILGLVKREAARRNLAVIIVSHNREDLSALNAREVIVRDGICPAASSPSQQ